LPGSGTVRHNCWLIIETDEGITGRAHSAHGPVIKAVVDAHMRDMLVGHDPLLREFLWEQAWEMDRLAEFPIYALGLPDIALWDIAAQVAGVPAYKLMGGYRNRIPAYASTTTFETTEEFLHVADQCLDYGFGAIKLHAWGDYRKDAKLCQDLRAHVGDEIALMYDGSAGFDLIESLYVAKALEEANYLWLEEPMREFSIGAYRRLAEAVTIPILSGETSDGAHFNIADFIENNAADVVRTSTHYKGGITGGLRIAHLAEAFHMRAEVHGGGLPNLHLACAVPNNTYYESLVDAVEIVVEQGIGRDGCISPPDVPGLGWHSVLN
jgi:L-alanine-DL-glutamate epimerase-like enolase superfamily enzyme